MSNCTGYAILAGISGKSTNPKALRKLRHNPLHYPVRLAFMPCRAFRIERQSLARARVLVAKLPESVKLDCHCLRNLPTTGTIRASLVSRRLMKSIQLPVVVQCI